MASPAFPDLQIQLDYYRSHGPITDPRQWSDWFEPLADSAPDTIQAIQGLFLHIFWAERYGAQISPEQQQHVQSRTIPNILSALHRLNPAPLLTRRTYVQRFIGNCRDFTTMLCAILRSKGVPARARCGFARYFRPGHFEDHWVAEYWDHLQNRWVMTDPQLDEFQCETLKIDFDPLDMPPGQFITGPEAWRMCRSGAANPEEFGIFDMRGLWFVRGDFIRDLAALHKVELLPWDSWGLMLRSDSDLSDQEYALLDQAAEMAVSGDPALTGLYSGSPGLIVPRMIKSFVDGIPHDIDLGL